MGQRLPFGALGRSTQPAKGALLPSCVGQADAALMLDAEPVPEAKVTDAKAEARSHRSVPSLGAGGSQDLEFTELDRAVLDTEAWGLGLLDLGVLACKNVQKPVANLTRPGNRSFRSMGPRKTGSLAPLLTIDLAGSLGCCAAATTSSTLSLPQGRGRRLC